MLYALVVMFTLTSLGFYFRSRESDRRLLEDWPGSSRSTRR